MSNLITSNRMALEDVKNRFVSIRGELSLLASDVAALYGVEPREINQAVKNNPKKFPVGYVTDLTKDEIDSLRSKFLIIKKKSGSGHHSKYGYKAVTEKGLYMLATIVKGPRAIEATLSIVETYAQVRELKRELVALHTETDKKRRSALMTRFGDMLTDIVMPDLDATETESSLELNFFIGKLKHTVRRVRHAEG